MFRMLGAAVAALVLSAAGSASAAVLYEASGTAYDQDTFATRSEWADLLTQYGVIDIAVTFDFAQGANPVGGLFFDSFRKYNTGHEESLLGEAVYFMPGTSVSGYGGSWLGTATTAGFNLRLTDKGDYHCEDWQPGVNCYWDYLRELRLGAQNRTEIGYNLTISTVDGGSAVPEPATWAMLIVGFMTAGAMLRQRRQAAIL